MRIAQKESANYGVLQTCKALGISRATFYRRRKSKEPVVRTKSFRRISNAERQNILSVLTSDRFMDKSPYEVYATLIDEGVCLCSVRTMYRILKENKAVRERRNQLRHPAYTKPELLATGPNQVWSWDITKLKGPGKWNYFYLYVMMDIFSRYVTGWMIASRESATLAKRFIREACDKQNINPDQLTIHSDRGPAMKSLTVSQLLADLCITKSFSRPRVCNDNPYSESHFKTMKYHPEFPRRFGCMEDAKSFCRFFFRWYNQGHRHSGIAYMTPEAMHSGKAIVLWQKRQAVLDNMFLRHPERFVRGRPVPPELPKEAWINKPGKHVS